MNEYPMHINKSSYITDDKILVKYAWAFTLGDGSIIFLKNKNRSNEKINACFCCSQVEETEEYSLWRADILSNITSLSVQKKDRQGRKFICTQSNRHPLYTIMRNRMYLNKVKVIDPHDLKLLDWEIMAILYQDDGSLSIKDKERNYKMVVVSTQSFSYGDNILLQRAIKEKLDILFSVTRMTTQKGESQYRLQLQKQHEVDSFLEGVRPFIKPCFEYKLDTTLARHAPVMGDDIV